MIIYKVSYKCRLCGGIFSRSSFGAASEVNAIEIMCNSLSWGDEDIISLPMNDLHFCGNGNIGVSDFIGIRKE